MYDILQLLEQVLGNNWIKSKKGDYLFFCPKCNHHKRKLQVNIELSQYHCWVCHFKGRNLKSLFRRLGFSEYASQVRNHRKLLSPEEETPINLIKLPDNAEYVLSRNSVLFQRATNYLKNSRKLRYRDIELYNIHYDDKRDRIVIPSYDTHGRLNTYNSRSLGNSFYKYEEPYGVDKNAIIGFESMINWNLPIVLVEGMFDAIAVRHNAIPILGTAISKKLVRRIIENDIPIYICLDGEARKQTNELIEFLYGYGIEMFEVHLDKFTDPNSLGYSEVWRRINKADKITYEQIYKNKFLSIL